jgi:flavodoxin
MKIGIIVHSRTGNTLSAAEKLKEELSAKGHSAELMRVIPASDDTKVKPPMEFKSAPVIEDYEVLLFGAPVWGFSLSTVMQAYLEQLPSLKGKKIGCFVTHMFPFAWMGGNSAIKQFKALCEAKGGEVSATAIVNWSSKGREKDIAITVEKLGNIVSDPNSDTIQ